MKIAVLVTGLGMGGAEVQAINLSDEFASLGHEVLLVSLVGNAVLRPINPRIRVECLNMSKSPWSFGVAYLRARRILRAFGPDVVHSHMVHANIFARLLRLTISMRVLISSAHSTNEGGAARMLAYRFTAGLANLTTNVSQEAVDRFVQVGAATRDSIIAMPNGIDCRRFHRDLASRTKVRTELQLPGSAEVLLAVGRFVEAKDYPNLIKAFASLCSARADCILLIAGASSNRSYYETLVEEMGIVRRVKFLGPRGDIPALMNAADLFVLSSAWEGLPLVVGEAMACERIVVSTDAGGIREWLGSDLGYVVPTRDSIALSKAIEKALELSTDEKAAQGKAARDRILNFYSLNTVAARWLSIYQRALPLSGSV